MSYNLGDIKKIAVTVLLYCVFGCGDKRLVFFMKKGLREVCDMIISVSASSSKCEACIKTSMSTQTMKRRQGRCISTKRCISHKLVVKSLSQVKT